MSGNLLKRLYETVPTEVKSTFAPLFVKAMVNNPEFQRTWAELERYEGMSPDEKAEVQLDKLKDVLIYAGEYVPHYGRVFSELGFDPHSLKSFDQIKALPILEKSEAIAEGDAMYSIEKGLGFYETFTGGSSGQALCVLLDSASVYRERAFACYSYAKHGFDPRKSRTAAFWGHNKPTDCYYSPLKNEIVISPFRLYREGSARGIVEDIMRFGAKYLAGYPSAIFQFVRALDREGLHLPINHIFYYAENYESERRDYVNDYLGCSSSSDYGHTEHAVKAEVGDDFVEFNDLYGYTELVPTGGLREYRIVCTGFTSRKMPLIRYATDDIVVVGGDGARNLVGHKASEVTLVAKDGSKVFKGAMTLHLAELSAIESYQYYQTVPGRVELDIVTSCGLTESEIMRLESYLERRVEGMIDIEIRQVNEIRLTARGKAPWAVCDIPDLTDRVGGVQ